MKRACPTPLKGCKYASAGGCFADDHHIYFPDDWYTTKDERKFVNLFVVNICRRMHDEIHAIHLATQPPPKPTREQMLARTRGLR